MVIQKGVFRAATLDRVKENLILSKILNVTKKLL